MAFVCFILMSLGQIIAGEIVRGFCDFRPKKIRFFGFDDWLIAETTRAFYNLQTDILVFCDDDYLGVWEYREGFLLCQGQEVYQINVDALAKICKFSQNFD